MLGFLSYHIKSDSLPFFVTFSPKNTEIYHNVSWMCGQWITEKITHIIHRQFFKKVYLQYPCKATASCSSDLDKSTHSVNMSHPWICWWRRRDQLLWQQFSVTPHVTKHLEHRPLARHWYWEPVSRINNKWMMRLRTRLGARASLWIHLHFPVLITACAVLAGPDHISRKD